MCLIETSPEIETRRLTLRAPTAVDAPRIAKLCNDLNLARMTARMPHPYALSDAEVWIGKAQGQDPTAERNFVIDHEDAGVIGMISLFPGREGPAGHSPAVGPRLGTELGYCIGTDWQGRGFATEAVQGALSWARSQWRRRAIAAGHFADNPASGRVLEKVGFLYTGERRPMFSVARDDWAAARMMVWLA